MLEQMKDSFIKAWNIGFYHDNEKVKKHIYLILLANRI